jgi:hypothetical protein
MTTRYIKNKGMYHEMKRELITHTPTRQLELKVEALEEISEKLIEALDTMNLRLQALEADQE